MPDEVFDVDALLSLARLSGLTISPDGSTLVTSVAQLDRKGNKFVTSLWAIDVAAQSPPRRLTRSAPGESNAVFLHDGSLLFTSPRPDPDADPDDDGRDTPALWRLPAGGGEPWVLAEPPGGVGSVVAARESAAIVFAAEQYPGAADWSADAEREKARKDREVKAQLFTDYPIRHWDSYLGPREAHLHIAKVEDDDQPLASPLDLVPNPGRVFDETGFDVTPDGRTVVTTMWRQVEDPLQRFQDLVAIDTATREVRVLTGGDAYFDSPACSPDGRYVACIRTTAATPEKAHDITLWLIDLWTGDSRDLTPELDLWPASPVWAVDGAGVFFTADFQGRTPPYRVDVRSGRVTRLAARGAFSDLCPSPDGTALYALQSMVTSPPQPVVLDPAAEDQDVSLVTRHWSGPPLPGRLERISVRAEDGSTIWSWLLVPPGTDEEHPAPLAVLIHGGPLGSWTGWHWRWSPHIFAARGYAVLLPDPALSTGYGQDFIERGWGRWGSVVYEDVLAAVDAACWRTDIDHHRTAALGGSFGGYMANWIATHTDRFRAIVTHASLWSLPSFHGTTDLGVWWEQEFGDPYLDDQRYRDNSPHLHSADIKSPVLVIHGETDYRVPVGQGLTLWTDLRRHGVQSQFLYFPDEHHWILKPNNTRLWYETVLAFLDHHVLGQPWERPNLL
jgi:dipeptidyl aminopeptidase/acylaminoacyl peptidase